MKRRLGGLAALLALATVLLAVAGAAGDATRDPREGGPRYDLAKAKIAQHKHDLIVHLRTWEAFPKLQGLERHPRTTRARDKRFVCAAIESRAADRLLCPAGKPEKGHVLVGVSRLSKGGRAHSLGVIRADVGFRVNRLDDRTSDGRPNPDPGQRIAIHVSFGESF